MTYQDRRLGRAISRMEAFAEALSEHGNVHRAADEAGISHSYGRVLLQRICRQLGKQAA